MKTRAPKTLCAEKVAELCSSKAGRAGIVGDGGPMDICVLTEKAITHGDILVQAIPIGGLRMIDGNEADDKVVAVLQGDAIYGALGDIAECPPSLTDRLRHYFLTYKQAPDRATRIVEIAEVYGRDEAHRVIRTSHEDYRSRFGDFDAALAGMLRT